MQYVYCSCLTSLPGPLAGLALAKQSHLRTPYLVRRVRRPARVRVDPALAVVARVGRPAAAPPARALALPGAEDAAGAPPAARRVVADLFRGGKAKF